MSYDCSLRSEPCPHCGKFDNVFIGNYTYNCSGMLYKALKKVSGKEISLNDMDGWKSAEVLENLIPAVAEMEANPDTYRKMNPENGWGDYDGWVSYLKSIIKACQEHPDWTLDVS
jgi:hypothetical protein